jgi:REP element-mobilizing transposase RayT
MPHPLRMYESSSCWFITSRCLQARKLMTPHKPLVREVCGGVLARAAQLYNVKVYAYVFMSNHLHLVIGARGNVIADFVKYLLGNLAKKLGPLCTERWWGKFWERRASVAPILDDAALEDRVKYVLAHGVKEGLVRHAEDWAGLHCAEQMQDGKPRSFNWFNWTRRWLAKHQKGFNEGKVAGRYEPAWATNEELRLSPLPSQQKWPHARRAAWVRMALGAEEACHRGKPVQGMDAVRRQTTARPRWRKLGARPWCHSGSAELWKAWKLAYRRFYEHFRFAALAWLAGEVGALFPRGCFKPFVRSDVQVV